MPSAPLRIGTSAGATGPPDSLRSSSARALAEFVWHGDDRIDLCEVPDLDERPLGDPAGNHCDSLFASCTDCS